MTDSMASLQATIAGLQEQIDAMNGQLTEVRPCFTGSCPFRPRAVRARRAAPPPRRPRPRGAAAGAAARASPALAGRRVPALAGRRGRTAIIDTARAPARASRLGRPPPQHRKLIDTGDIDAFWLIFGGVLVFWMQAGFAMLEVGSVNKKNTKNILVKNIFDACIAAIMWYAVGSSLAGGNGDDFTSTGENGFAGSGGFFRTVSTANKSAYAKAGWFFGWTFAGAGCTIVSGAIAERATFLAYACTASSSRASSTRPSST